MKKPSASVRAFALFIGTVALTVMHDAGAGFPGAPSKAAPPTGRQNNFASPSAAGLTFSDPMQLSATGQLLMTNIAEIVNRPSALINYQLPAEVTPLAGVQYWNGLGELPNRFNPSPELANRALFQTSYWNVKDGFTNSADAPWNTGLAGRYGLGRAIFDSGMGYVGSEKYASLLPGAADSVSQMMYSGAPQSAPPGMAAGVAL